MIRFKNITLCIALASLFSVAKAQEQESEKLQRELLLEREYNPDILDATKIFTTPELAPLPVVKSEVEYAGFVIPYQPDRTLALLNSGDINTAVAHSRKRGYINFAGGNYLNLNGDAGYHILQNERDRLSLWYSHRSSNGKIKYLHNNPDGIKQRARLNDNTINLDYGHTFKRSIWSLAGRYGSYGFNYYGQSENLSGLSFMNFKTMQRNQLVQFNTGLASKGDDDGFHYDVNLVYYNFSRKYMASENDNGVKENSLDIDFDFFGKFNDNKRFGLDGHINGFFYNPNSIYFGYKDYVDVCLNPYFGVENDTWNLRLGALVHFDVRFGDYMVSPDVRFDWQFARQTKFYINATGDVRHNSNREMQTICRYITPFQRVEHTRDWLISEIGIRSQPATPFWFDVNTGYDIIEDEAFFVPTHNMIGVLSMNATKLHVGGALNYQILSNLTASARARWNSWKVSNNELEELIRGVKLNPYGKPTLEIGAGLTYRPIPKLLLELDYNFLGGRHNNPYAFGYSFGSVHADGTPYDYSDHNDKLTDIHELNFKSVYTFNDTFSLYAKANNLLFQCYELWWGYPMQGFNFQIGGAVNF